MAHWLHEELDELGPGLRAFVEASIPARSHVHAACARCAANGSDCRAGRDRDGVGPAGRLSESAPSENACAGERRWRLRSDAHAKAAVIRIEPPGAGRDTARQHAHKRPTALAARANADPSADAHHQPEQG